MSWLIRAVLGAYLVMSIATFVAFWLDKRAARAGRWRIPESTLHMMELCGGFAGAFAAQRWLRHKSAKPSYRLVLWGITLVHAAAWAGWMYYARR